MPAQGERAVEDWGLKTFVIDSKSVKVDVGIKRVCLQKRVPTTKTKTKQNHSKTGRWVTACTHHRHLYTRVRAQTAQRSGAYLSYTRSDRARPVLARASSYLVPVGVRFTVLPNAPDGRVPRRIHASFSFWGAALDQVNRPKACVEIRWHRWYTAYN